jgi:hypothetical protein
MLTNKARADAFAAQVSTSGRVNEDLYLGKVCYGSVTAIVRAAYLAGLEEAAALLRSSPPPSSPDDGALKAVLATFRCASCGTASHQPNERCENHQPDVTALVNRLGTELSMHAAWRKRAEEAEAREAVSPSPSWRESVRAEIEGLRRPRLATVVTLTWNEALDAVLSRLAAQPAGTRREPSSADWKEDCLKYRGVVLIGKYAHWCAEWDGLPIDEHMPEWPCGCYPEAAQPAGTPVYYAEALDLAADELAKLAPEKVPERAPKIIAIMRNAAHAMKAQPAPEDDRARLLDLRERLWSASRHPVWMRRTTALRVFDEWLAEMDAALASPPKENT